MKGETSKEEKAQRFEERGRRRRAEERWDRVNRKEMKE